MLRELLAGTWLGAVDRISPTAKDTVTVFVRGNSLDADTLSILLNADELSNVDRICLVTQSRSRFLEYNELYLSRLEGCGREVIVAERGSADSLRHLLRSRLLILTDYADLPIQRMFLRPEGRHVVRIYHGVITKSYGRLKARLPKRTSRKVIVGWAKSERMIHARSVGSDVELHFRATAEGLHPAAFKKWGYPRYDRAYDLVTQRREPVLPDGSLDILTGSGRLNILYAPTHKDHSYSTTLFPFADFRPDDLRAFLREHDLNLLLRMHLVEESSAGNRDLIDGEHIHGAGRAFSPSPIEMLPFVHLLITDYSSIYMDFLPFDRPVLFVNDERDAEAFNQVRGISFDYETHFPGQKVRSMAELLEAVGNHLVRGEDPYAPARAFVRKTFLPDRDNRFMAHMNRLLQRD